MSAKRRSARIYLPPWRDRQADGTLSEEYGPRTPSAYAKALRRYENWAFRFENADPASDRREVIRYMRGEEGVIREDVPDSEVAVYQAIYEQGLSIGAAVRMSGLSRSTVKSYLRRLKARVAEAANEEESDG